jgi:hypothetical protein
MENPQPLAAGDRRHEWARRHPDASQQPAGPTVPSIRHDGGSEQCAVRCTAAPTNARVGHALATAPRGALNERARHRGLRRRPLTRSGLFADGLPRASVLAGRDAGKHPLQHDLSEVSSAVRARGRLTCTRRPPSVTSPSSRLRRTAVPSRFHLPFGPTIPPTSSSSSSLSTSSPTLTLSASSPPSLPRPTARAPLGRAREARPNRWSPARPIRSCSRRFLPRYLPDHPPRSHQERTSRRDRRHLKVLQTPGQPRLFGHHCLASRSAAVHRAVSRIAGVWAATLQ